jgi:hypothetical protein
MEENKKIEEEKKIAVKLRRQQKRLERQQDPEEDKAFKDKHNSYYASQSEETKLQNKVKRKLNKTENFEGLAELDACIYASRSEDQIGKYKRNREEAIERCTEEEREKIKKVM